MSKLATEAWIIPITTYYHNQFIFVAESLLKIYDSQGEHATIIALCNKINSMIDYDEEFYEYLLRSYNAIEDYNSTVNAYNAYASHMTSEYGIKHNDTLRSLYREALNNIDSKILDVNQVREQIVESFTEKPSAYYCDYDIFSEIYHAMARSIERTGTVIHLALINITDINDNQLSKRSLTVCVNNLKEILWSQLRQGDIVSMCSPSQFILLLPNANREDSFMVLDRISSNFFKKYPHSPAKLTSNVDAVLPPQKNN